MKNQPDGRLKKSNLPKKTFMLDPLKTKWPESTYIPKEHLGGSN